MSRRPVKDSFAPAQPVSYSWYNEVAQRVNTLTEMTKALKEFPGYSATATQALMSVSGHLQWVTVEECTTT